jgi:hypothetical protein
MGRISTHRGSSSATTKEVALRPWDLQEAKIDLAKSFSDLRSINIILSALHAMQGIFVLILGSAYELPVHLITLHGQNGSVAVNVHTLLVLDVRWMIAAYFIVTAIGHLLKATVLHKMYQRNMLRRFNPIRWVEYSISSTIMLVLLALVAGVTSISAITAVIIFGILISLCGLAMESSASRENGSWWPFWIGIFASTAPWILIIARQASVASFGEPTLSTATILTYAMMFVLFMLFPGIMYFTYKRQGIWKSYLNTELAYMMLSLFAKTALAWLLYFDLTRAM